jgi:hypothetical protein
MLAYLSEIQLARPAVCGRGIGVGDICPKLTLVREGLDRLWKMYQSSVGKFRFDWLRIRGNLDLIG